MMLSNNENFSITSELDTLIVSPCSRRIEVVVKPQVRMRSLAIKTEHVQLMTSPTLPNLLASTNNNGADWLSQARYSGCRNDRAKPPFSYASLIAQAILSTVNKRLTLLQIYNWIMDTFPYYQSQNSGWQNSIRHNLSLNRCFVRLGERGEGKGSYWGIDESLMEELNNSGLFKRRKHRTEKRKYQNHPINLNNNKVSANTNENSIVNQKKRIPLVDISNTNCDINSDNIAIFNYLSTNQINYFSTNQIMDDYSAPLVFEDSWGLDFEIKGNENNGQLRDSLGCPELTEENYTIQGQVVITSEYY